MFMECKYNGGVNFFELLTLLFVYMQLTGYINWEWYMIFSPLIINIGVMLLFGICTVVSNYNNQGEEQ